MTEANYNRQRELLQKIDDLNYKAKAAEAPALKKYYLDLKRDYEAQLENIRHK